MKKNLKKGFTLIELLVVIAIIGILASVILASLNSARAKGVDASTKEDLSNARAQAEIFYDGVTGAVTNTYSGVCTTAGTSNGINTIMVDAAAKSSTTLNTTLATAGTLTTTTCHDSATGWAAAVPLKSVANTYFCVDSTGVTKTTTNPIAASAVVCS